MMTRSRIVKGLALVLVLLVCLLSTAPARLLGLLLPADQVIMQGFKGTIWRGSASRCLVQAGPGYLHLGTVSWELQPLSLLLFAPRMTLDSSWGTQTLATELVVRGSGDIDLHNLEAKIPADLLRQYVPVALSGVLSLQLEQLQLRGGLPERGAGRLVWQDGAWQSPTGPVPLGSYALDFSQAPGAELVGVVLTLAGPVTAEGGLRLLDRRYAIDISVQAEGSLDTRLQQALSLMARPLGNGYRIKLEGELQ